MRRLPSGGTKARQAPSKEPARCSWKIGGRGLLLLLGLVLALAACSSDPELTIVTEADPEPVEEAPGSPGLHAFRDLSVQLEEFATDSSGETSSETARDDFAERPGAITDLTVGLPSEEAIKSGLYGGTAENTCRPEKLIQFLLDNPSKGQVWADVQGIRFVDIPDYIRTLKPTVLTEAVTVLNHGFDPKGHAIPIVSTLAEGTAVLVDENGDVRTRCYCGNPILPYTPVDYTPPKCLSHYAVVYVSPNNRESLVSVPRSVRATKNIATYDRVRWTEIAWGTDDKTGWVRTHEAQDRYCKPPETISCVGSSDVLAQPAGTRSVGSITNAHISILTPDVEGWTLIKFGPRSGWIRTSQLNDDTCNYDVDCVEVSSGTWTQPGRQGQQFVPAGYAQTLRLTGQTIVVNGDAFLQAYVMYPAPTRIGYVRAQDITELPATDCEPGQVCTPFDQDIPVYVDSTGTTTIGWMWFGQKPVISGPTNGRYEIDFAGTQGWIDLGDLNTAAPSDCPPEVRCIEFLDDAYVAEPPSSGRVGVPIGVPTLVTFTGDVYGSQQNPTYHKFHTTNIATAWVETSVGYKVLDDADCLSGPICRDNVPEHQPCRVECVTEFNVGLEGEFGWQAKAIWSSTSYPLNLKFLWPSGLPAVQKLHYPGLSGATSFLPGPVLQGPIPQNGRPVQLEWTNPNTQQVGVIDCEINWCTIVPFEADFGEFFELFELIPEDLSCLEVECAIDTSEWQVPNTGGPTGANITWTNTPASSDPPIDFHFNWGGTSYVDEQQVGKTGGSTSSTSLQGSTFVTVTWFGPDGQVGTLDCVGCVDDVIYADGAHICCREGEPELGESGRCCNIPDVPLPDGSYCCPPEDLETRNCCPDERFVDVSPEFCERAVVVGQPVKPVPITPTPTPTPTPTATPPPPITPTPTATPTPPGICEEPPLIYWNEDLQKCVGWKVVPIPATPVPPPPTATAVPLPTVTPGPVCELGVGPNGECISYCDPGDLLTTRTCVCEAPGTQEGADGIQCEIVCPAGQINLTTTLCGVPEVPTAVVQPTVEVPRCTAPLRWNEVLQQCTD